MEPSVAEDCDRQTLVTWSSSRRRGRSVDVGISVNVTFDAALHVAGYEVTGPEAVVLPSHECPNQLYDSDIEGPDA